MNLQAFCCIWWPRQFSVWERASISLLCCAFPASVLTGLSGQMGVKAGTKPAEWASGLSTELKPIFHLDKDTILPTRRYCSILAIKSRHSGELG